MMDHWVLLIILALIPAALMVLGISVSVTLNKRKVSKARFALSIVALALTVPIGAAIGYSVFSIAGDMLRVAVLAFGVAALLYLVAEELLVEAHEIHDTRVATSAFFVGFLIILLIS